MYEEMLKMMGLNSIEGYLCDCGADPEDVGSKPADLNIDWTPIYN